MSLRDRIDAFPTHRWVARLVFPVFIAQRITHVISNDLFDSLMLGYLWWLSEVTMDESWRARRLQEDDEG